MGELPYLISCVQYFSSGLTFREFGLSVMTLASDVELVAVSKLNGLKSSGELQPESMGVNSNVSEAYEKTRTDNVHKPDPRPMPEVISGIGAGVAPDFMAERTWRSIPSRCMLELKRPMPADPKPDPKAANGSVDVPKFDVSKLLGCDVRVEESADVCDVCADEIAGDCSDVKGVESGGFGARIVDSVDGSCVKDAGSDGGCDVKDAVDSGEGCGVKDAAKADKDELSVPRFAEADPRSNWGGTMSGMGSPRLSRNCIMNARTRVGISFLLR